MLPTSESCPPGDWVENVHFVDTRSNVDKMKQVQMSEYVAVKMVQHMHITNGHCGRDILRTLMENYSYHGKDKIVSACARCVECEAVKSFLPTEETHTPIITIYPLERVQMNVTYPTELRRKSRQEKWLATARDHFCGYTWVRVISDRSSQSIDQFFQEILSNIKPMTDLDIVPSLIQYDQGTEGRGNFQQAFEQSGAKLIRSGVAHPQSNGDVEQFHGKVKPLATLLMYKHTKLAKKKCEYDKNVLPYRDSNPGLPGT